MSRGKCHTLCSASYYTVVALHAPVYYYRMILNLLPLLSMRTCLPSSNWSIQRDDVGTDTRAVRFCKISTVSTCHISHSVNSDSSWKLTVHGQQVSHKNCTVIIISNWTTVTRLQNILERSIVCPGNPYEKFVELIKAKKRKIMQMEKV